MSAWPQNIKTLGEARVVAEALTAVSDWDWSPSTDPEVLRDDLTELARSVQLAIEAIMRLQKGEADDD